ncbi:MAG: serine/threonine-protein kinase [Planctomycetota bacterium]|nr:serine/threonine-protein kinase [Planctomycetota bacterium]
METSVTNPSSLPPQIGPYLIEGKLGAGGMGTVYKGRHKVTGSLAAVKVLPPTLAREDGFVERFNREIEALRKLENPHVVKLFDSGVDEETSYYAMEYVEGETLTQTLYREKRLPWRQVIEISLQICSALKAAHDAGIIHRDLKPSNLMISPDGTVKLTDFGVAQVFAASKLTVTGGIIGTAEYMSPEQTQGQRVTKKSDLYSLGAVMYVMITGRPPFTGKTTIDIIQKHRFSQFDHPRTFVPEIPSWLDEIVCTLLDKNPDKRFPDAFVLSRRLNEVLMKVEISSGPHTVELTGAGIDLAPTVVAGETKRPRSGHGGAGVGTMMRNFLRAEIESELRGTPVSNFFSNTIVLVVSFVLLIAGGFWWFSPRQLNSEQQFDAGVELMKHEPGTDWVRAKSEFFQPLLAADPETWQERVAPYLEQIELYELKSTFTRKTIRKAGVARNEIERWLKLAKNYQEFGDDTRSEAILTSLLVLLDDEQNAVQKKLVEELLIELSNQRSEENDRYELAHSSLAQADTFVGEGKAQEAVRIWQALIVLYEDDPQAKEFVDLARQKLVSQESSE